jgi:hypothetical protein
MCPNAPAFTCRAPQSRAIRATRSGVAYGSVSLPTTRAGEGKRRGRDGGKAQQTRRSPLHAIQIGRGNQKRARHPPGVHRRRRPMRDRQNPQTMCDQHHRRRRPGNRLLDPSHPLPSFGLLPVALHNAPYLAVRRSFPQALPVLCRRVLPARNRKKGECAGH